MKYLIPCLLFISSFAFGQAQPYAAYENIHWNHGKPVVLTYSHSGAPGTVPASVAIDTLNTVANRLNGLGLPGLTVVVGATNLPNACAHKDRDTVHVCWEVRDGRRADSINTPMSDGSSFWREGIIILGNQADWTDATRPFKQQIYHYLMHILGFAHPVRPADNGLPSVINNIGDDLSQVDIEGLQMMYAPGRCAVTYDEHGQVYIPFVSYAGRAYTARLQHQGGGTFTIVPGTLGMYSAQNIPVTPCQNLTMTSSGVLQIPEVWVNGSLIWATLQFGSNNSFTVTARQ